MKISKNCHSVSRKVGNLCLDNQYDPKLAYVGHRGLFLQEQSKTLKITEIHKTYLLPADLTTFPIDFKISTNLSKHSNYILYFK